MKRGELAVEDEPHHHVMPMTVKSVNGRIGRNVRADVAALGRNIEQEERRRMKPAEETVSLTSQIKDIAAETAARTEAQHYMPDAVVGLGLREYAASRVRTYCTSHLNQKTIFFV